MLELSVNVHFNVMSNDERCAYLYKCQMKSGRQVSKGGLILFVINMSPANGCHTWHYTENKDI